MKNYIFFYMEPFLGRIMPSPTPKNIFIGAGDVTTHPWKWWHCQRRMAASSSLEMLFLREDDVMTRLYK
jgi:hypothetical protein